MKSIFGTNRTVKIFTVQSTYSSEFDDWFVDNLQDTGQKKKIKSATQEEICRKIKLNRKNYKALISKNEIYVVVKKTNEPIFCLKTIE